jgi:hypothetical protein
MESDFPDHVNNSTVILSVDDSNIAISGKFDEMFIVFNRFESDLNVFIYFTN